MSTGISVRTGCGKKLIVQFLKIFYRGEVIPFRLQFPNQQTFQASTRTRISMLSFFGDKMFRQYSVLHAEEDSLLFRDSVASWQICCHFWAEKQSWRLPSDWWANKTSLLHSSFWQDSGATTEGQDNQIISDWQQDDIRKFHLKRTTAFKTKKAMKRRRIIFRQLVIAKVYCWFVIQNISSWLLDENQGF